MKINRRTTIIIAGFSILSLLIMALNWDYFLYLSDDTISYKTKFDTISSFFGGDSRYYYNLPNDIVEVILTGVVSGQVGFGSILSLIGIYYYTSLAKFIFSNLVFGVLIFNLIILGHLVYLLAKSKMKNLYVTVLFFPLTLNYILVPNKEIFGLYILVLLAFNKTLITNLYLLAVSLIRESYIAIWIASIISKYIKPYILVLIFCLILPLVIPSQYFETFVVEGQRSSAITNFANDLIKIPILSFVGIIIKIILGLFSGLIINISQITIIKFQYFICALINLTFFFYYSYSKSFRRNLKNNFSSQSRIYFFFAFFMCLAPGNPARFLAPLTFIFLIHLLNRKRS